jgi:hypothetical protein
VKIDSAYGNRSTKIVTSQEPEDLTQMTRQEFKSLVHRNQRGERFFGYAMFLFPLGGAMGFLGNMVVDYVNNSQSLLMIKFALVVLLLCAGFAWWGIRKINKKFRTFILISFDATQLTAQELVNGIVETLNYRETKNESGLLTLHSDGWQTGHEIYAGSNAGELFADLRLNENYGFFSWTTKKLKERLVNEVISIGKEKQCEIMVTMEAE